MNVRKHPALILRSSAHLQSSRRIRGGLNHHSFALARFFSKLLDLIVSAIASALAGPSLSTIQESLANAQNRAADVLASYYLPQLPTRHEIVGRAIAMFAETPSMDAIVSRAHIAILEAIGARLSAVALQTKAAAATS
jgi:hypothetical protein